MGRGQGSVRETPSGGIFLDFRIDGDRIKPVLKGLSYKVKSHRQLAQSTMDAINHDKLTGQLDLAKYFPDHPFVTKTRKGSNISIEDALEEWLDFKRREVTKSTWRRYASSVRSTLIPAFGKLKLSELTTADIKRWIREQGYLTNKTISNNLIPLRQILADALMADLVERDPFDRIQKLAKTIPDPEPFSTDEASAILASTDGQIKNIIQFGFETGLRISELIALRWADVDLENRFIFVCRVRTREEEKSQTKTDLSKRKVDLSNLALKALDDQLSYSSSNEHVFLNPKREIPWKSDGQFRKIAWLPVLNKSRVRYRPPKTMRQTFASHRLSAGLPAVWVYRQMGHRDYEMLLKHYGRWIPDYGKNTGQWEALGYEGALSD